jgi:hypothetical protein
VSVALMPSFPLSLVAVTPGHLLSTIATLRPRCLFSGESGGEVLAST